MLLDRLARAWRDLAGTRSRNTKRDLIAAVYRDAFGDLPGGADAVGGPGSEIEAGTETDPANEIEIVTGYLAGSLRQRRTGIGWRTIADPPAPAPEPALTVTEVDAALEEISGLAGPGSAAIRQQQVAALFARATADEQQLLRGLIFGELRQGALEAAVQDGLAAAYAVPKTSVRRAAMLLGSTPAAARLLSDGGLEALDRVRLQPGIAVQPMLAASAASVAEAVDKTGLPVAVDAKLDGVRVQVHKIGDEVSIYSRSLDDITDRMPAVVESVRKLPQRQLVLDGEALALREDGSPESFQRIASSVATRDELARAQAAGAGDESEGLVSLQAYFFDLLRIDDRDLLDEPLSERIAIMSEALPAALIVPRIVAEQAEPAEQLFADVVGRGFEGVVLKNPSAPYAAGRRDSGWIKVKPRHTFDLVIIAAEWGHGRRQGWLSNLHLAAPDETSGELIMLGKTFKGLTDEMLTWQTERFLELETRRTAGTVHVRPEVVAEIAIDGLQSSTRYPGGVALRFARVLRYREDKPADQADTLQSVRRLLDR